MGDLKSPSFSFLYSLCVCVCVYTCAVEKAIRKIPSLMLVSLNGSLLPETVAVARGQAWSPHEDALMSKLPATQSGFLWTALGIHSVMTTVIKRKKGGRSRGLRVLLTDRLAVIRAHNWPSARCAAFYRQFWLYILKRAKYNPWCFSRRVFRIALSRGYVSIKMVFSH